MLKKFLLTLLALAPLTASAQDPLKTLPHNYWLTFENSDVAVIRAHYGPHEKIPVHDHAGVSTIFVYLNDSSPVRIDHDSPYGISSIVRPPTTTGAFRVVAAMPERHSIENLGDKGSDFLRIELKQVRFPSTEAFRGPAPKDLSHNQDTIAFEDAGVQIERIICASGPCAVKPIDAPSLLVAVTPSNLGTAQLKAGEVQWQKAGENAQITSGQLLRVVLPKMSAQLYKNFITKS